MDINEENPGLLGLGSLFLISKHYLNLKNGGESSFFIISFVIRNVV